MRYMICCETRAGHRADDFFFLSEIKLLRAIKRVKARTSPLFCVILAAALTRANPYLRGSL